MTKLLSMAAVLSLVTTAGAATGSHGVAAQTHFITYTSTGIVYVYFDAGGAHRGACFGRRRLAPGHRGL